MNATLSILCLLCFLTVYEGVRGVIAFRKGARFVLVTKDLVGAAVIVSVILLILYVWHEFF